MADAEHLADVANLRIVAFHLEDMKLLAVSGMISNSLVTGAELHIAHLPFAEVVEDPIVIPPVLVPERFTRLAREQEN